MGSGGTEVPFNGGKPQGLITLQEAIAIVERVIVEARKGMMVDELIDIGASEMRLVLAAAKAFACKECNGNGLFHGWSMTTPCPACAEFRRVAREGVEG